MCQSFLGSDRERVLELQW